MRGRDLFSRYENVFAWLSRILNLFPPSFAQFCLDAFRHTPGLVGFGIRYILLRRLAKKCGRAVSIYPGAYFINTDCLEIGDYVSIHQMCYLESYGGLSIGSNVAIAHGVSILTLEHDFSQVSLPMRDACVITKQVAHR
jgi:acetyltransferase-like isoleucine patch superfamily enzyme